MRKLNGIIVHCSATPEGKDFTVADITKWHIARGFNTIGYHYVIYLVLCVHTGGPIEQIGAHCQGHNADTVGVCYIGGLASDGKTPRDTRTLAQKDALVNLLLSLKHKYPSISWIRGHRDFANKACPSFDATKEYKNL